MLTARFSSTDRSSAKGRPPLNPANPVDPANAVNPANASNPVEQIVVPIDGSDGSLRALGPAAVLAVAAGADVIAAMVVAKIGDRERAEVELRDRVAAHGVDVSRCIVEVNGYTVGQGLRSVTASPGSLVVVATDGHSRTRPLTGSVAEELVHARPRQPTILVGPAVDVTRFDLEGPIILCADPDRTPGRAELMTRRLANQFALQTLAITVLPAAPRVDVDRSRPRPVTSISPVAARNLARSVGRDFQTYLSHNTDRSGTIIEFAEEVGASLLAVGTHQREGLSRLAFGSVAIKTVTEAHCPVLAVPETG